MTVATVAPYEMDAMGAWSDSGKAWLPRSLYSRTAARTMYANECGCTWISVRVLARYARHAPDDPAAAEFDGNYWTTCRRDDPGSFPVWECE